MCYPKSIWDFFCCPCICFGCYGKSETYGYGDDDENVAMDRSAERLSYVGMAAYDILRSKHTWFHHTLWNVTTAKVIGSLQHTPRDTFPIQEEQHQQHPELCLPEGHDDWFPQGMCDILAKTEYWADVMSLSPPDGKFLSKIQEALGSIADRSIATRHPSQPPIIIRFVFGNIVSMPVNCNRLIRDLTKHLPENANIRLYVGAWRKGVSWNHAKIIAVDGRYLHTGGHNLWDAHYLQHDPVYDLSVEFEGRVALDGHSFANQQWAFIRRIQSTFCGYIVDKIPDGLEVAAKTRVAVSEYPQGVADIFPPQFEREMVPMIPNKPDDIPVISIGRQGTLFWKARPSDDAILAMLEASTKIIRLVLQDLGPVCVPGTKITLPGCVWPKQVLSVLGKVIWNKGVDVEIVLSNPGSIPGGLKMTDACYGNGWSCVDVAAEIIKTIRKQFPEAEDAKLRQMVSENLRVCFIKDSIGSAWKNGMTIGLHSKHFIIDDICAYIGSQNLYICDLAEWGVVIDDEAQVLRFKTEFWDRVWKYSYSPDDCDVQAVMDGLNINRDAQSNLFMTPAQHRAQKMAAAKLQVPARIVTGEYEDSEEIRTAVLRLSLPKQRSLLRSMEGN